MYQIILAAALTTGGATEQWHGCYGCGGCYGSWAYSCTGGACYGCYGCSGSYGSYGCGCSGYGYGGYSPWAAYAMYGNYAYGCYGCYGSYGGVVCSGGLGAYGGWSGYGVHVPPSTSPPPATKPGIKIEEAPLPKEKVGSGLYPDRATVVVEVPTDAKVFIDGSPMRSADQPRVFRTPVLTKGPTYFYDVRAEVVRDGQTVSQSQRVFLQVGQRVVAHFDNMENRPATAATPAGEGQSEQTTAQNAGNH